MNKLGLEYQNLNLKLTVIRTLVTTACVLVPVLTMPATAQELKSGSDTNYILVYGQFNKGFLFYDDGQSSKWYPLVDNDSSSSRFGIRAYDLGDNGVAFGANIEFEWEPYSTGYVNYTNSHDVDYADVGLRKAEVYISHDNFGKLWAGHGSMASDGTSEVDQSGTSLAGYASVGDIAGAQLFRISDGSLSDIRIYDAFPHLDGLGRKNRVRYDTPEVYGFSVGTSVDIDWNWDVALKYQDELGDFSIGAAAAYSITKDNDDGLVNGSMSVLHIPTGFSLTVAAGSEDLEAQTADFIYGKLGYQASWFAHGNTYFSIDAYSGNDINTSGSKSKSYGFAMVQNVNDWNTDYYLGLRTYDYDDPDASYRNGHAVIFGARIKF